MSLCSEMLSPWELRAEYDRLTADNTALRAEVERLQAELHERCPVDAIDRGMTPVEAAVWHVWGERCSTFEPECLTCKAWSEFDQVERLRAALSDPVAVHINMLRGVIAKPTLAQIIHLYGEDAIRAALEDRHD